VEDRLKWGSPSWSPFICATLCLGNLARYLIWPVVFFYAASLVINAIGIAKILFFTVHSSHTAPGMAVADPKLFWQSFFSLWRTALR